MAIPVTAKIDASPAKIKLIKDVMLINLGIGTAEKRIQKELETELARYEPLASKELCVPVVKSEKPKASRDN